MFASFFFYQLKDGVSEELQPLVGPHGQVAVAERTIRKGSSQKSDVVELDPDGVLELDEFLKRK